MKMMNKEILTNALQSLRQEGYAEISATELAYVTRLAKKSILANLHNAGVKTVRRHGEVFASLVEMKPIAQNCELSQPKSAILREVD